ncbi:uncharacterized protein DNG_09821 [Cephalotrichum gorgonifer]|uniref:Uncharacterized protein n=1 Tax=Cephalotrichum gorgonifer TaxID=2041049 RepID=A0AAE8T0E6_9PEZI|nr:uncharacterized protein DNG_09821 [Cephalotrichum gorgonifer]
MSPPAKIFPACALPQEIQRDETGRRRKPAPGATKARIELSECELLSMPQYECSVQSPETSEGRVHCYEVVRFFRRCADKKGHFMVETTNWEKQQREKQQQSKSSSWVA